MLATLYKVSFYWPEVKIRRFDCQISFEGKPDEDSRSDGDDGKEAAADGDDNQGQGRLVMNLVDVDVHHLNDLAHAVFNLKCDQ